MKLKSLLLTGVLAPTFVSAQTYTWNPAATATFDQSAPLFTDGANWGGTAPTAGSSIILDTDNAVNSGGVTNLGAAAELRLNVNSTFTVAAGQSITTTGSSSLVDYADLTIRDGGVLDVYGNVNISAEVSNIGDRIITTPGSTLRLHSGSNVQTQFFLPFGATEYVIDSASDTFSFSSTSNASFELGTGIGFDLSGLTGSVDGISFDLFTGTLTGTYDDATTYVTGGDYAATINQSGTGAGQTLSVTFTAVPEPSSAALLGLGALSIIARRKR